jgi:hypothetical protein
MKHEMDDLLKDTPYYGADYNLVWMPEKHVRVGNAPFERLVGDARLNAARVQLLSKALGDARHVLWREGCAKACETIDAALKEAMEG